MKKIKQGRFEVFTSKNDAINKLIQLQGYYQEKNIIDRRVEFTCEKDGRIIVYFPQGRKENWRSKAQLMTKLTGKIVEQENKTYITYCTGIDSFDIFVRLCVLAIAIVVCLLFFAFVADKIKVLIATIVCIAAFISQLVSIEKESSSLCSDILVDVLKKQIDAVNTWDRN